MMSDSSFTITESTVQFTELREIVVMTGGGGTVESVTSANDHHITVDSTDPDNPVLNTGDEIPTTSSMASAISAALTALSSVYQPLDSDLTTLAGGTVPTFITTAITNAITALSSVYQPLDSDLTTLAGNGVTSGITSAISAAIAALSSVYQPLDSDLTTLAGGSVPMFITTAINSAISALSSVYQPLDATLTALAAYNTNGLVVQTAADTFVGRTLAGTANRITVSNGDGVSGPPTFDIGSDVVTLTGSQTLTNKSISFTQLTGQATTAQLPTLASARLFVGNGSSVPTAVDVTGDVTITNAGATAIKSDVALAGNPTVGDQADGNNTGRIANTKFVTTAIAALSSVYASIASVAAKMTNPMSAVGDLIRGGTSGAATALTIGVANQILGVSGGIPAWLYGLMGIQTLTTAAPSLTNASPSYNLIDTTSNNVAAVLPLANTCGGKIFWFKVINLTNVASITCSGSDLIESTASISPVLLQVVGMISDGVSRYRYLKPMIESIASGGTGASTKSAAFDALSPMTTAGDLIYGGTSGTGTRLGTGSEEALLGITGGLPAYRFLQIEPSVWQPLRQFRAFVSNNPNNPGAMTPVGTSAAITITGTAASGGDSDGCFVKSTSAATTNSDALFISNTGMVQRQWAPRVFIHFKTGAVITVCRIWVGLTSSDLSAVSSPTTQHVAALRYDPAAGDTTFRLITCDGASNVTNTDTGITPVATTNYTLCLDMLDTTKVKAYLSVAAALSTLVATNTSNLPGSTTLIVQISTRTLENVAKDIRVDNVVITEK